MAQEALLYTKESDARVSCALCAHRCRLESGRRGICGVRENRAGTLVSLNHGKLIAEHCDPIEKKPFFHVLPGSRSYSLAAVGCNFRCTFCQNYEISQMPLDRGCIAGRDRTPAEIVVQALKEGCQTIAYTYTEPTVFFEFAWETAGLARKRGLKNLFVTNGYLTAEALDLLAPRLDAANVDLKAFSDDFYRKQCGARLEPVLETLRRLKALGIWVEVTTLLIPGLNDSAEELTALAAFIRSLGPETPWHISRFHPMYRMQQVRPTPAASIHRAVEIGKAAGLRYVYSGNLPGDPGENSFCSHCGRRLIERAGFTVVTQDLRAGACPHCGTLLDGIF